MRRPVGGITSGERYFLFAGHNRHGYTEIQDRSPAHIINISITITTITRCRVQVQLKGHFFCVFFGVVGVAGIL